MRFFIRLAAFSALALVLLQAETGLAKLAVLAIAFAFWMLGFSATSRTLVVRQEVKERVFLKDRRKVDRTTDNLGQLSRDQAIGLIQELRSPAQSTRKEA